VTRTGEIITTLLVAPMKEVLMSSETSVVKTAHGITSQKKPFFIVTVVKTSNLTYLHNV
jgi:hypothetical protein